MNILIFDTETTSLEKPFCYNIGYVVANADTHEKLLKRDFVVEQVWHNLELFSSAYYADKRPIYVASMKARKTILDKYGYILRTLRNDIKDFEIEHAYAFNSPFDEKVFNFCCEWFKCSNPFDTVKVHDIRGYVHKVIAFDKAYQNFCEENELFTDSGNYQTTAESVTRFITQNVNFNEEHTALADSEIETDILFYCQNRGCDITQDEKVYRSIPRNVEKQLRIIDNRNDQEYVFNYTKKTQRLDTIYLK